MNQNNLPPRRMVGRQMYRGNQPVRRDPFFDSWEKDFDRTAKRTMRGIITVWVVGTILTLAFWGVVIWGIIELVQWVTAQ